MADLRLWSREVISDFIEQYKNHKCLWDMKCDGYKNKLMRANAYKDLVRFCKERGFPEANRDFAAKKLQSLRGSFRKEMRKTEKYDRAGLTYQSNLWYYNNLLFIKDQTADDEHNQIDDENQSVDSDNDNNDVNNDDEDDETKFSVELTQDANKRTLADSPPPSSPPPKRRKKAEILQPEFLDMDQIATRSKDLKDLSEFELIGMNLAKKLARMNYTQVIYAESLINNVIRRGLLNHLKEETDLCNNLCGRKRLNLPSQSFSH